MSRISLIAVGASAEGTKSSVVLGPGLRLEHLATALVRAGHEVQVVSIVSGSRARVVQRSRRSLEGVGVEWIEMPEASLSRGAGGERPDLLRAFGPDGIVGVTAYGATLATRLAMDVPLWADIFGDPMAEAQAKASAYGSDAAVPRFMSMLLPALERADRFSAVSRAHADALIGQLGLVGRLALHTAGERLVEVIPCAAELDESERAIGPAQRERLRQELLEQLAIPRDAFVVLWSGSFNTWCDVATTVHGLDLAMASNPSIYLVATGGAVVGHDERTWGRFRELVDSCPNRARFVMLGWVDDAVVRSCYLAADVGVNVERHLYERRLGAENRVAQWIARGIPCVTTALSESGRDLTARGLSIPVEPCDARSLAAALGALARDRSRCMRLGAAVQEHARAHLGFDVTAAPLLSWALRPVHARDFGRERSVQIGLVSEPAAMIDLLECYLSDLGLGEAAYRGARWLARQLARRVRGILGTSATRPDHG
jgi:glycosyltransferase involved in cell wall biosynthesis